MSAHIETHAETQEEKIKKYWKVFAALSAITALEVAVVYLPIPKIAINIIVTALACFKAGLVGYYYMHLEHETKWLRFVVCLPIGMFIYAAVLIPDTEHSRPVSAYMPENPRVLKVSEEHEHGEGHAEGAEAVKAEKPEAEGTPRVINIGPGQEAPVQATNEETRAEAGDVPKTDAKMPSAATVPAASGTTAPVGSSAPSAPAAPAASGADDFR